MRPLLSCLVAILWSLLCFQAYSLPLSSSSLTTPPPATMISSTTIDSFLASIRPALSLASQPKTTIVTGNEAADLDSIVSAISTAFLLSVSHPTEIYLPLINIDRQDLSLRPDVIAVLSSLNINPALLFFLNDLELFNRRVTESVFLVDHNQLTNTTLSSLNGYPVSGVLDHHQDEGLYKDTANPRRIEVVGSCTSLVVDTYFDQAVAVATAAAAASSIASHQQNQSQEKQESLHVSTSSSQNNSVVWVQQLARFLLGPIVADTNNLDPKAGKVKPLDIAMVQKLLPLAGWNSTDDLSKMIDNARKDVSKISTFDLLRKDYKEWTVQSPTTDGKTVDVKVGISSVVWLLNGWVARDGQERIFQAMEQWTAVRDLDLCVVMLSFGESTDQPTSTPPSSSSLSDGGVGRPGFRRQLVVLPISQEKKAIQTLIPRLESLPEMKLERISILDSAPFVNSGGKAYEQHNITNSRKQVWPIMEKLLTTLPAQTSSLL